MLWNIRKSIKKGEYLYALVPEHPKATKNGYVLFHRVVVENRENRILNKNEIVHHKDHNRFNNESDNLEVLDSGTHNRIHKLGSGHGKITATCPECRKTFEYNYNQRPEVKGLKQKFCSRHCNGLHSRKKQLARIGKRIYQIPSKD